MSSPNEGHDSNLSDSIATLTGLAIWLSLVALLTLFLAPSSPSQTDRIIVFSFQLLLPIGAFHVAGNWGGSRTYWMYFAYGILGSMAFMLFCLDLPSGGFGGSSASLNWDHVLVGCVLTAGMGPACLGAARLRHRLEDRAKPMFPDAEAGSTPAPFIRFIVWLIVIPLLASIVEPGLSRISWPQIPDFVVFLLIPLGAYHIAGCTRSKWVFGVFGMTCSVPFLNIYLDRNYGYRSRSDPPEWVLAVMSLMFVIGVGLLSRGAAKLRHRLMDRKRDPGICRVCKYDLTGNVSGVCPECGIAIEENGESPRAKGKG